MTAALLLVGGLSVCEGAEDQPEGQVKSVRLVVDYGDGVQKHFTELAWREKMTALDALSAASRHPRGVKFEHRGRAATVLVTKIDELKNEGAGRNWVYRVNGKLADRSCGVFSLSAGDTVLWRFEKYR